MLAIPEERKHIFSAVAYMIERKLLDLQTYIIAHRHKLRYVCIKYAAVLSEEGFSEIEKEINKMYDLPETFCREYDVDQLKTTMQSEFMVKENFL